MPTSIQNRTRQPLPRVRFSLIQEEILGPDYDLSLVFIGPSASKKLNHSFRQKNYPTNILSFSLEKKSGEIFIDLTTSAKESSKFSMSKKKFIVFLFIHGLLHLKGMAHGRRMEEAEKKYLDVATNRSWY